MKGSIQKTRMGTIFMALISGIMWAASFPPLHTGFLAYFFLIPFWVALDEVIGGWRAIRLGYFWGLIATAGTLWWLYIPTIPGMVGAILYLPVFCALYAWMHYLIARFKPNLAIVISPILFVAVEYLRSWGILGFPWLNVSYSQTYYPLLIQFADIAGSFGVSLWVAAINSCVYFILKKPFDKKFWIAIAVLILLFAGSIGYGLHKIKQEIEGEPIRVALLQGNVDAYQKWTRKYQRMNASLYAELLHSVEGTADLVVMPETATACYHRQRPNMFMPIVEMVMNIGIPTLTGTQDFEDKNKKIYYNSSILITPDGDYSQYYHKMQLVPFSEQVPFQDKIPILRKLNFGGSHFTRGENFTVFDIGSAQFAVLICYESVFDWIGREFTNRGAEFFVNITNDGWFGNTSGPHQHAMFNVIRAIENRKYIARCANTGISMFIDTRGRIVRKTSLFEKAILTGVVIPNNIRTTYDRIGNVAGWGSFLLAPILVILSYIFWSKR